MCAPCIHYVYLYSDNKTFKTISPRAARNCITLCFVQIDESLHYQRELFKACAWLLPSAKPKLRTRGRCACAT